MTTPRPKAAVKRKSKPNDPNEPGGWYGWMFMRPAPGQLAARKRELKEIRERQELAQRRNGRRPIKQSVAAHRCWIFSHATIKRFKALDKTGKIMAAHDRVLYTTDEAAAAAAEVIACFNVAMKRRGLGARIEFKAAATVCLRELWPGAGMEALRILTGPELYERGPDGWCGPFLEDLMLAMLNPGGDQRQYRKSAKNEWDKRLRQTKQGMAYRGAEIAQQQKERIDEVERRDFRKRVERLSDTVDGIVPAGWPHTWKAGVPVPRIHNRGRRINPKPTMKRQDETRVTRADKARFKSDMDGMGKPKV